MADTFGNTVAGSSSIAFNNDYRGCRAASPAYDAKALKLSVYQNLWGAGETMIGALYDAADNSLVGTTQSVSGAQTQTTWVDLPFSPYVDIYSTKSYYCMVLIPHPSYISVYYTSPGGSSNCPYDNNTGDLTPPAVCVVSSLTTSYCVYCTYAAYTTLGLAGTSASVSSASGAIGITTITRLGLAGTVASVSSASGAIGKTEIEPLSLAGIVSSKSSVIGDLSISQVYSLAGTVSSESSVTGNLSYRKALMAFPYARSESYNEDLVWDEVTQAWVSDKDLQARDGSRYHAQLVVIGMDLVYYEAIT